MSEEFDTVSEIRSWLDEDPSPEAVEEALETEKENQSRVTAKRALKGYLEEVTDPGGDVVGVDFRVQRPFQQHTPGDVLELDPDETETQRLRRAGYISLS